jgi:hypothetical protein
LSDSPGYIVYTDGSAWTGDRIGAYAWVIVDEDGNEVIGGASETDTTISRMELMGAIDALESVRFVAGPCVVLVYSDSEYVVFGITDRSRKRNLNVDLWDKIIIYLPRPLWSDDFIRIAMPAVRNAIHLPRLTIASWAMGQITATLDAV